MREKLARFMVGRNGADALSKFFLYVALVLVVITMFSHNAILYLLGIAALVYSYFRMMSRNVSKRYYENQQYLRMTDKIRDKFRGASAKVKYQKSKVVYEREQKKIYKIYYCPSCKQKTRVPKGKGKIMITCPKCKMEFIKRT